MADSLPLPYALLPPFQIPGLSGGGFAGISDAVLGQQPPAIVPPAAAPVSPVAAPPAAAAPRAGAPAAGVPGAAFAGLPPMPTPPQRRPLPEVPQPTQTDPLMALGNPLSMLAILGSFFTRQPAVTALNSMAAAAEAGRAGDKLRYEQAYHRYQLELKKAMDEFNQEQVEYEDAYANRKLTFDEKMAQVRATALRTRNSSMLSAVGDGTAGTLIGTRRRAGHTITTALQKEAMIEEKMKTEGLSYAQAAVGVERDLAKAKGKGAESVLGDFSLEGEEFLESIPIRYRATIKAIAEGRQQVPNGRWGEALREAAFHYKPDLRGQGYSARGAAERNFSAGEAARGVRAINTLIGHLGRLSANIPDLGNSDFRLANKAFRSWAQQSGDPRYSKALADIHAVAEELGRVFKGTVTEGEVHRTMALLDAAQSPEQLQASVSEFVELMNSRLEAFQAEYQRTTGRSQEEADALVTPHSKETLKHIEGNSPKPPPARGTVMDGYRFKGGDPAKQENWERVQ